MWVVADRAAPSATVREQRSHGGRETVTDDERPASRERLAARRGLETTVYGPAEDSELLVEAAVELVRPTDLVLEVGTGSGHVAAAVVRETGATVYASDINPHACEQAASRGLETLRATLTQGFRPGVFDWVLFNPPYLPAPETSWGDWMSAALTGGTDGMAVIDPFLAGVSEVLRADGEVLMVASSLTGLASVEETARKVGFDVVTANSDRFPFERLDVLRLGNNHGA